MESMKKKLIGTFLVLQILVLGGGIILGFVVWKNLRHTQHIKQNVWPVAEAAMEMRILLQEEELELFQTHWNLPDFFHEEDESRVYYEQLEGVLQNSSSVGIAQLSQLKILNGDRKKLLDKMKAAFGESQKVPIKSQAEVVSLHKENMRDLASTMHNMHNLLASIEKDSDQRMTETLNLTAWYTDIAFVSLIVVGVMMLGVSEFFRRLLQRLVVKPITQMIEEIEAFDLDKPTHRVRVPETIELKQLAFIINQSQERLIMQIEERRQRDHSLIRMERMASVGLVASGIVHNLRSPLTIISGESQLLLLKQPNLEEAEMIERSARQMNEMIEEVLSQSRVAKKPEKVNLNMVLEQEMRFLQADLVFKHEVEKNIQLVENLPLIDGVLTDISQIFGNLIRNAVDAMYGRETKRLVVKTEFDTEYITVEVTDTGCGISEQNIPQLFAPFFTTKSPDAEGGGPVGTGLGLYTVQQLLEPYRGTISVESRVDEGTTFRVKIPLSGHVMS